MEQKVKYEDEDIATVNLNFDVLKEWRNEEMDDVPVCSCVSFYKACGLIPHIEKYHEEHENAQVVALDNILCNFYTNQRIKNFIRENWEHYSLDIKEDNHVVWDTTKYGKGVRHKASHLKKRIEGSIQTDFLNFCPGIDDELPDDVLVFRVFHKVNIADEEGWEIVEEK